MLSSQVLTADEQFNLVGKLTPVYYNAGETITEEGGFGDNLYIIERGECEVIKEVNGQQKIVDRLTGGDSFGQLALLYDMPRSATVKAVTNMTMISLERAALYSTLG